MRLEIDDVVVVVFKIVLNKDAEAITEGAVNGLWTSLGSINICMEVANN